MTLSIQLCQGIWVVLSLLLLQTVLAGSGLSVRSPGARVLSFSWVLGVGVCLWRLGTISLEHNQSLHSTARCFSFLVLQNGGADSSPQSDRTHYYGSQPSSTPAHPLPSASPFYNEQEGRGVFFAPLMLSATLSNRHHYAHFAEE